MTVIPTVVVLVLLTQASPGAGAVARFRVTLEFRGVWGLVTEANGTCPGVVPGTDTITGVVEGPEPPPIPTGPPCTGIPCQNANDDEDDVRYTGVLTRSTDVGLCEVKDTADGERWCAGRLKGGGPFKVVITVPGAGRDNENLGVELEPGSPVAVWATVSGQCSSLDNQAVADQYKAHDTIFFETSDPSGPAPSADVPPVGGLYPRNGPYSQTRRVEPDPGYTLKVERVP